MRQQIHINQDKTCFKHFMPGGLKIDSDLTNIYLHILTNLYFQRSRRGLRNKIFGVTVDNKLFWEPHITTLNKICIFSRLKCIPKTNKKGQTGIEFLWVTPPPQIPIKVFRLTKYLLFGFMYHKPYTAFYITHFMKSSGVVSLFVT